RTSRASRACWTTWWCRCGPATAPSRASCWRATSRPGTRSSPAGAPGSATGCRSPTHASTGPPPSGPSPRPRPGSPERSCPSSVRAPGVELLGHARSAADPTAARFQALGSGPAARPVDLPEAGQGRGQLQVTAEAFEARLVCEPLLHAMDELVDRRVARVAQLEAAALPALLAAHVDAHRAQSATGAIWREPS